MINKIVKRDGREVSFDIKKIKWFNLETIFKRSLTIQTVLKNSTFGITH